MLNIKERDPENEGKISLDQLVDMYRIYEVCVKMANFVDIILFFDIFTFYFSGVSGRGCR